MPKRNVELWQRWRAAFSARDIETMIARYRAAWRHSEAEVAMPATTPARFRDSLVTYIKAYLNRASPLKDLGVSEDDLEPLAP